MQLNERQLALVEAQVKRLIKTDSYYGKMYRELGITGVSSQEEFEKIPFASKDDLRHAYPLGIQDVEDWATMFARCYATAGITNTDRIQITPGYGLWTAGIGFQAGCEKLGAMAVPMGPGNTDKQRKMMVDLKSTVLCATSSYALLLAEEIAKRGIKDQICLKKGVIGSERWGDKMRKRIATELGIELYDIYGLTEVYGPGIGINCNKGEGIHIWDDYLYIEILDPVTGEKVPEGEVGEIVLTTLKKEGAPLIRFRTHDLSRWIPGDCPCGRKYPRIGQIVGRTDDMVKVKGCNIFPSTIEDLLKNVEGASSEYQVLIDHNDGKDELTLSVEAIDGVDRTKLAQNIAYMFKEKIGMTPVVKCVGLQELPRSEKKTARIIDKRF